MPRRTLRDGRIVDDDSDSGIDVLWHRFLRPELSSPVRLAKNAIIVANVVIFVLQQNGELNLERWCKSVGQGLEAGSAAESAAEFFGGVLVSMFVHATWEHLVGNMLSLHFSTAALPSNFDLKRFLLCYFGGGVAGFMSNICLTRLHRHQFEERLRREESRLQCDFWWCDKSGYNTLAKVLSRGVTASWNMSKLAAIVLNESAKRVGASAGVYSVLASSMVLRLASLPFRKSASFRFVDAANLLLISKDCIRLVEELKRVPWTLDALLELDQIDHTAHAGGFIFGASLALFFLYSRRWVR